MTVTETTTTTSSNSMGMNVGGNVSGAQGPDSDDLNKRFKYRTGKLVEYKGLIDFL